MRKFVVLMLVLLGGTALSLQGQNDNSFGLRLGAFDPTFINTNGNNGSISSYTNDISLQLVRDWGQAEAAFWRGRLGVSFGSSSDPINSNDYYNRSTRTGVSIFAGRGKRIDLAPFSLIYGGEFGVSLNPYSQIRSYSRNTFSGVTNVSDNSILRKDAGLFTGLFLQLDWNIHRNIWIGMEQRFTAGINYATEKQSFTTSSTPQGGGATTTTESEKRSYLNFSSPIYIPYPTLSVTFRPGGK